MRFNSADEVCAKFIIHNFAYGADAVYYNRGPGGGIFTENSFVKIFNNTICFNYASSPLSDTIAAGIGCYNSEEPIIGEPIIKNNIISNNHNGFGVYIQNGFNPEVSYNDVWNNEKGDFLGCVPGIGNFSLDPQFTHFKEFYYCLKVDSPCIDAGDPSEKDGIRWPAKYKNGSRSDMGAYGGTRDKGWIK